MTDRTGKVVTSPGEYDPHFFGGPEDCADCVPVSDSQATEFIWKKQRESGEPFCCIVDCGNDAEYAIYGESNHPDDNTHACEAHVGALLGTPVFAGQTKEGVPYEWTKPENLSWTVVMLSGD